jgi:Domain of unknown function (DUF4129)
MNRCLLCALLLIATSRSPLAFGQAQSPATLDSTADVARYDVASFTAELHRLSALLDEEPSVNEMTALRDALPRRWTVSTPEHTFTISSEPLRNQLTALSADKARVWVDRLAAELDLSAASPAQSSGQAQAELQRILARPEFAAVRPPSAWELFRQRLAAWVGRMLMSLFGGMGRHPIGGKILFWFIIVAGVGAIALWMFRFLASRDRLDSLPPSQSVHASRTWQEWIRTSREAAHRGDFREAVHAAYWAGIVRLEDTGVVPRDRTKTPREYLRLVTDPLPGEVLSYPSHREPLRVLTARFERTWYANRGAGPEDFSESLRQLEALGCQLE